MHRVKKVQIDFIVFLTLIISTILVADSAEFRTTVSRNDGSVGGELHLDLEMRITGGTTPRTLNSFTVDLYYGPQLTNMASSSTGWAFASANGYNRSVSHVTNPQNHYRVFVAGNSVNDLCDGLGPFGWNVTTSYQKIMTLKWTIVTATTVNLNIDDGTNTSAYFKNEGNNPCVIPATENWTTSNQDLGDTSLPVELSDFTATMSAGQVQLNWTTESEVANLGFNIYRCDTENGRYEKINSELIEGAGDRTFQTEYEFIDVRVKSGDTYWYKLEDVDINGRKKLHSPTSVFVEFSIPDKFYLDQNYPNPFNPSTTIAYGLPESGDVLLQIFNVRGEMVKELVNQHQQAGAFKVVWDATSNNGLQVPTGLYFAKIKMGHFRAIKKCLFAK
jgi:hypothetical protein